LVTAGLLPVRLLPGLPVIPRLFGAGLIARPAAILRVPLLAAVLAAPRCPVLPVSVSLSGDA
jgi:hypothetical protein